MIRKHLNWFVLLVIATIGLTACEADTSNNEQDATATVSIKNDFNNPEMSYNPPWTICESAYMGVEFGMIGLGETSNAQKVVPGIDYVLMIAAWDDPTCDPANCLPIATKNVEEVVDGQTREIDINMPNHQGPCPPEGVAPIPQEQYDRILVLWPEYGFLPYDQRTENTECQ